MFVSAFSSPPAALPAPTNKPHVPEMKRARDAPSIFEQDSDSDGSCRPHRQRPFFTPFQPITDHTAPTSKNDAANVLPRQPEPDSLDAFMSTLKEDPATSTQPKEPGDVSQDESSDDEFVVLREVPRERLEQAGQGAGAAAEEEEGNLDSIMHESEPPMAKDLVLQPVDHSHRIYPSITLSGYTPLPKFSKLTDVQRVQRLSAMGAHVSGKGASVVPVDAFEDLKLVLPSALLELLGAMFEAPTSIQRVAIPVALEGGNVIGVAKTGSGKTVAYSVPLLCHVERQCTGGSGNGKGPTALVVAPTRELALQIAGVVKRLGEGIGVGVMCVVGGHAKYEQFKRLRDSGAEVVVCTPGRLIDMLKMKACGLGRCSFVVLDEADRMLDMGFGPQVDGILSQIRPDAQKLLFSATFPQSVAVLAKEYLLVHTRITIGNTGGMECRNGGASLESEGSRARRGKMAPASTIPMVSENVTEMYLVFATEAEKESWLLERLDGFIQEGLVIVFCSSRGASAALANIVRTTGKPAACVHGETDPADREGLIHMFRAGELPLLITTDLTARGLDIANIKNVVNYGCAKSWDWHVHRVGRTGRATERGSAYTLICKSTKMDLSFVGQAIAAYRKSKLPIPSPLLEVETGGKMGNRHGRQRGRGCRGRRPYG